MPERKAPDINPQSWDFQEIQRWGREEIVLQRQALETPGLDVVKTENARGAIEVLKKLVNLGKPSKARTPDAGGDDTFGLAFEPASPDAG